MFLPSKLDVWDGITCVAISTYYAKNILWNVILLIYSEIIYSFGYRLLWAAVAFQFSKFYFPNH